MSDHECPNRILALLAKPGIYGILHAMYTRSGVATFAEVAAEVRDPLALIRALAVEGFMISDYGGSLDVAPGAQVSFSLTAKGAAVAGHVIRLQRWVSTRPTCHGE